MCSTSIFVAEDKIILKMRDHSILNRKRNAQFRIIVFTLCIHVYIAYVFGIIVIPVDISCKYPYEESMCQAIHVIKIHT
jgi:hypothetical protein